MTAILGAGLSGLIAATQFPNAPVYERASRNDTTHKAVLRFRSDAVSRLVGIPFRRVTVRKGIWSDGGPAAPSIQLANLYSLKTHGAILDRSIWNLDTVERFIAPEDFQYQLLMMVGSRVCYEAEVDRVALRNLTGEMPVISTIPMPVMAELSGLWNGIGGQSLSFNSAAITVDRYRIPGADVHQTIYYPDPGTGTYRATMTGDMLIVERKGDFSDMGIIDIMESFGMGSCDYEIIEESHRQKFGKINPINDATRKHIIHQLTIKHSIYSLGRFAIWKNILLDDLVDDIACVKRFINQGNYAAALHNAKERK